MQHQCPTARSISSAIPEKMASDMIRVFDCISELIVYQDTQFTVLWANKTAGDSVGSAKEELVGRHCYEIWHKRSSPCEGCPVAKTIASGKQQSGEVNSPDGRIWQISAYPVRDESEKICGVIELTLDITERKKVQESLEETIEDFQRFYDDPAIGFWRTRIEDSVFLAANPATVHALGFNDLDELVGKHAATEFYSREQRENLLQQLHKYGEVSRFEARFILRDGAVRNVLLSAKIYKEKGYLEGTVIDITALKRTEELLRQSERKYRNLVETINEGLGIVDLDENILFVNSMASEIFGYSREELIGMNLRQLTLESDIGKLERETEKRKTGQSSRYEHSIKKKDGQIRRLFLSVSPFYGDNGDIIGATGVFSDITDSIKASQEKKKLQEQLDRAQRMESLGVLAGGVAHDLNNILGPLVAYPEIILMKLPPGSPAQRQIQMMGKAARDAAEVIQDLLTLARRGRYEMNTIDLNEVVEAYLASANLDELKTNNPRVIIEEKLDPNIGKIKGSVPHLLKVIMNLVVNAYDAMPNGGRLTLETTQTYAEKLAGGYADITKGQYIIFRVKDNGIGIEDKYLKHIFEPYYSRKAMGSSGTGLGLSVVYGIIKDHKGYYDVSSRVGEGTDFALYFPVSDQEQHLAPLNDSDYSGCESVLVVDDVEEQRIIASELLLGLGYKVNTATNGHEAVEYLSDQSVDLVVLDMIMEKDFDGLDTYNKIIESYPGQKAIIVSGFSATDRVNKALNLGVGQYIKKPYTLQQLGKAVREELDRK